MKATKQSMKANNHSKTANIPLPQTKAIDWHLVSLVMVLIITTYFRLNLLDIPLERDEGGHAYIAKMMMGGQNLYTDLIDSKLPGIYILNAFFITLFGYSATGIHFGLMVFNISTIIFIYYFLSSIFNKNIGLMTACIYAIQSLNPLMMGFAAHATQLLMLPVVLGLWLQYNALQKQKSAFLFLSGLLLGIGFLVKQQAIGFILFSIIYAVFEGWKSKKSFKQTFMNAFIMGMGILLPYLLCITYMYNQGRLGAFWFWTIEYPALERTTKNWSNSVSLLTTNVQYFTNGSQIFWILGSVGLFSLMFSEWSLQKKVYVASLLPLSFVGVAVGYNFYPHYFIMFLLPVSLLNALLIEQAMSFFRKKNNKFLLALPMFLLVIICCQPINKFTKYFFNPDTTFLSHILYGGNPFVEAEMVGKELAKRSKPNDKIAIFGSEPELLVAANRVSATSRLFFYSLVSNDQYAASEREKTIKEIEQAKPRFIINMTSPFSWMNISQNSQMAIEFQNLSETNYKLIGVVLNDGKNNSLSFWDAEAQMNISLGEKSDNALLVYERK
jgi:4-amino-4-deoxy-L-arabinose transferase-like glycosyltransferase